MDGVQETLTRFGDLAVSLEEQLRPIYEQGRTSEALIAIALALDAAITRIEQIGRF
jgi:hypothetical protein